MSANFFIKFLANARQNLLARTCQNLLARIALFAACAALLSACSSKQHYSPQNLRLYPASALKTLKTPDFAIPSDENFDYSSSPDGKLKITSKTDGTQSEFELDSQVVSISVRGNFAAMVLASNALIYYDLAEQSTLFRFEAGSSSGVIAPVVAPVFAGNLVLFPSLDGRLIVLDSATMQLRQAINVGVNDSFNNLIFLHFSRGKMLAISASKVLVYSDAGAKSKLFSISSAIADDENIYLLLNTGEILRCDYDLNVLASQAHDYALFTQARLANGWLYALELSAKLLKIHPQTLETEQVFYFNETLPDGTQTPAKKLRKSSGFIGDDAVLINRALYPLR